MDDRESGAGGSAAAFSSAFPIVDVSEWDVSAEEPRGKTSKEWLLDPSTDEQWLWKGLTQEATGLRRLLRHDWSEKVAAEIAGRIGVPVARLELARRHDDRGVISLNFAPQESGMQLSNGSELLATIVPGYDAERTGEVPGYSLDTIFELLRTYRPPPGAPPEVSDGPAAFAGVLLLDALIGNQDRHHDNWGVLTDQQGVGRLSPAFDQASCLGYQETDVRKAEALRNQAVGSWASRARSRHFEGRPQLLSLALDALRRIDQAAASAWVERLADVADDEWAGIVDRLPRQLLSQVDATFAVEVLRVNRRRVLDEWL